MPTQCYKTCYGLRANTKQEVFRDRSGTDREKGNMIHKQSLDYFFYSETLDKLIERIKLKRNDAAITVGKDKCMYCINI